MRAFLMLGGILSMVAMSAMATQDVSLLQAALTQAPGQALEALRVSYAPGEASRPHTHDRDAYGYVLEGQVRSQVEGQPLRTYDAGDNWFEPAGARHLVSANASASSLATILVVFVGKPRAPSPAGASHR